MFNFNDQNVVKKLIKHLIKALFFGGESGIRTHERVNP